MADVLGTFYSATKVRVGTSPSSPGLITGEVPPSPLNPPGSLNSIGVGAGLSLDIINRVQLAKTEPTDNTVKYVDFQEFDTFSEFVMSSDYDSWWNTNANPYSLLQLGISTANIQTFDPANFITAITSSSSATQSSINLNISDGVGQTAITLSTQFANGILITDGIDSKGLVYAANYSANGTLDNRWIPDWGAVQSAISGASHAPVTIGTPANGLSISGQELSIGLASTSATGALSSTDWNTFNGKLNLTSPITGYTVGSNTALAATDTILQAFGKVQGQIDARVSGAIASGQVAFGTGVNTVGGSNNLFWDSVNNRLGVNTNTPSSRLEISSTNESLRISGKSSANIVNDLYIVRSSSGTGTFSGPNIRLDDSTLNNNIAIQNSQGQFGIWNFSTGSWVQRIVLTNTNLFGVLTPSPTNTLDVNGTVRIRSVSNATGNFVTLSATGVLQQRTAAEVRTDISALGGTIATGQIAYASSANTISGENALFWDSANDRLGINQSSPTERLHVNGNGLFNGSITSFNPDPLFIMRDSGSDINALYLGANFDFAEGTISYGTFAINRNPATGLFFNTGRAASQINLESSNGRADIGFYTTTTNNVTPTMRMWIAGNGNVGIGDGWQAVAPTARLQVKGIGASSDVTLLLENSAGTDNAQFLDNGQILFLRLPTSSAGLPAGSLWNNGGVLNIV